MVDTRLCCTICGDDEAPPYNLFVICDGCNIVFHQVWFFSFFFFFRYFLVSFIRSVMAHGSYHLETSLIIAGRVNSTRRNGKSNASYVKRVLRRDTNPLLNRKTLPI